MLFIKLIPFSIDPQSQFSILYKVIGLSGKLGSLLSFLIKTFLKKILCVKVFSDNFLCILT